MKSIKQITLAAILVVVSVLTYGQQSKISIESD